MYKEYFWSLIEAYFIKFQCDISISHRRLITKRIDYHPEVSEVFIYDQTLSSNYISMFGCAKHYEFLSIDDYDYIDDMCALLPYTDAQKCELLQDMAKSAMQKAFVFYDY